MFLLLEAQHVVPGQLTVPSGYAAYPPWHGYFIGDLFAESPKDPHFLTHDKYIGETEVGSTVSAAHLAEMLEVSSWRAGKLAVASVGSGGPVSKAVIYIGDTVPYQKSW